MIVRNKILAIALAIVSGATTVNAALPDPGGAALPRAITAARRLYAASTTPRRRRRDSRPALALADARRLAALRSLRGRVAGRAPERLVRSEGTLIII